MRILDRPWAGFGLGLAIGYQLARRPTTTTPPPAAKPHREGMIHAITRGALVVLAESIMRRAIAAT